MPIPIMFEAKMWPNQARGPSSKGERS
jgi:hypothetical protein